MVVGNCGSIVSGHLEFNHTITKEMMFCIKEWHQEHIDQRTKKLKDQNSSIWLPQVGENCQYESSISNCCARFRTDFHQRSLAHRKPTPLS